MAATLSLTLKQETIVIDEGHKLAITEQADYIKEAQKLSKFKLGE